MTTANQGMTSTPEIASIMNAKLLDELSNFRYDEFQDSDTAELAATVRFRYSTRIHIVSISARRKKGEQSKGTHQNTKHGHGLPYRSLGHRP